MTGTYLDLQNAIADELVQRADLASQIILAIQRAIAKWEREAFYFNELYNTTLLTTVTGQEFYGGPGSEGATTTAVNPVSAGGASLTLASATGFATGKTIQVPLDNGDLFVSTITLTGAVAALSPAVPATRSIIAGAQVQVIGDPTAVTGQLKFQLAKIDKLSVLISGNRYFMVPRTWAYMEDVSVNPVVTGQPVDYAYFGGKMRFYPIPNGGYPVTATGTQRLTALAQGTDENAWTLDAADLIRCEAKADLYDNTLQEPELADRMKMQIYGDPREPSVRGYLYALKAETARRRKTSIRPTYF